MKDSKHVKVYFPNLDALRFFCFLSVFFSHSFATSYSYIIDTNFYQLVKQRSFVNGNLGVNFFFVLSGFLITYLLLVEKEKLSKIHIGKFYVRRILKIWPLYYFCILFGFVAFPILKSLFGQIPNETASPFMYVTFMSNFDFIHKGRPDSSVLSILWSISIEEQFYLIWPLIIASARQKWLPFVFLSIIIASLGFRLFHAANAEIIEHHTFSCISDMTVGGLGAYLSFYSTRFLSFVRQLPKTAIYFTYLSTFCVFFLRHQIFDHNSILIALDRLVVSVIFLFIILEQNFSERSAFKLQNLKLISKLGQYTYGLYCLHMIALLITTMVLTKMHWNTKLWQVMFLESSLSLALTIVLAYLSYHLFERRFLQLKEKFALVKTSKKEAMASSDSVRRSSVKPILKIPEFAQVGAVENQ